MMMGMSLRKRKCHWCFKCTIFSLLCFFVVHKRNNVFLTVFSLSNIILWKGRKILQDVALKTLDGGIQDNLFLLD